jgi:hypothetical protein
MAEDVFPVDLQKSCPDTSACSHWIDGRGAAREAARRVNRDVKGVHGDVRTLLNAGILQKKPTTA